MQHYLTFFIKYLFLWRHLEIMINPRGAQLGSRTQRCYEALGDIRGKIVQNALINIGLVRCPLENGTKLAVGQPNSI